MFQTAFENISLLVICMAIGFAAKRGRVIADKDMPGLSGVTLNVALPCLMIMSMQREFDADIFRNSLLIMALSTVIYAGCLAISVPVTKMLRAKDGEKSVIMLAHVFPNNGFMGIPIIYAMFGQMATFYAAMTNVVFNFVLFTVGVAIMRGESGRGKMDLKSILLNKLMLATIIGFLLFVFSIRIPDVLGRGISMVANMTTPLAMVVTGAMLASNDFRSVFSGFKVYVVAAFRLLILPLLVFFALRPIVADRLSLMVLTIITAMPVAVIVAIFAAEYDREPSFASKIVFITTVLSIFTIPLMVLVMEMF